MTDPQDPIDYLTLEDLLEICEGVVALVQVRDLGLLAATAARPRTTVFGTDAYPTFAEKAAALMHSAAEALVIAVAAGRLDVPQLAVVLDEHLVPVSQV